MRCISVDLELDGKEVAVVDVMPPIESVPSMESLTGR